MYKTRPPITTSPSPTEQIYGELQTAYDHFNTKLFDGKLPPCLITLQRKGRCTFGYYAAKRFGTASGGATDEIALNPRWFKDRTFFEVMGTLVHEMVHLWQHHFGRSSRGNYHNREWAGEMLRLGLHPSNTGRPGGRMTGQQMSHYAMREGRFEVAAKELIARPLAITWFDVDGARLIPKGLDEFLSAAPSAGRRAKFICPDCRAQAWGKPSLNLICGDCERPMASPYDQ
ncbi:MAG: SprT-like domain-containing protein [Hyphomicrobium sp.]